MSIDKLRGRIDFPQGGEGTYLSLRNSDVAKVQAEFGKDWWTVVQLGLGSFDVEMMGFMLGVTAKKEPHEPTFKLKMVDLDDTPITVIAERLVDALYVSAYGKTYEEWLREMQAKQDELEAEARKKAEAETSAGS